MMHDSSSSTPCVRVIVVANEKGGSGKSTVAIHLAIALIKSGQSVATIDLDCRQRSFTHYIDNRLAWARQCGKELPAPTHVCFDEEAEFSTEDEAAGRSALISTLENLANNHSYVIIDTPGQNHYLPRLAHSMADTLITPLNDSFVDLDVLGSVDPDSFSITGISHYGQFVEDARRARQMEGKSDLDWIVLRNRLSNLASRNKRFVGDAIRDLSQSLGFRCIEGFAERVIYREFYPRGLTAVDELSESTLGARPTMSHVTAQLEVQSLVAALLGASSQMPDTVDNVQAA
jgi:chromosome partitioning protein